MTGLSSKLQGSSLDTIEAYEMMNIVKDVVSSARTDDVTYEKIYKEACTMAHAAETEGIQMPRRCDRQT